MSERDTRCRLVRGWRRWAAFSARRQHFSLRLQAAAELCARALCAKVCSAWHRAAEKQHTLREHSLRTQRKNSRLAKRRVVDAWLESAAFASLQNASMVRARHLAVWNCFDRVTPLAMNHRLCAHCPQQTVPPPQQHLRPNDHSSLRTCFALAQWLSRASAVLAFEDRWRHAVRHRYRHLITVIVNAWRQLLAMRHARWGASLDAELRFGRRHRARAFTRWKDIALPAAVADLSIASFCGPSMRRLAFPRWRRGAAHASAVRLAYIAASAHHAFALARFTMGGWWQYVVLRQVMCPRSRSPCAPRASLGMLPTMGALFCTCPQPYALLMELKESL